MPRVACWLISHQVSDWFLRSNDAVRIATIYFDIMLIAVIVILLPMLMPISSGGSGGNSNNGAGGAGADGAKMTSRIIHTKYGSVSGVIVHLEGRHLDPVEAFRGIPYASPPVGSLRFMPPVTGALWSGVKKADRYVDIYRFYKIVRKFIFFFKYF